jgi:predicted NAD-dependent protein-ADP-ribosyltransferase YbiA (DUF1768 family)
VGKRKPAAKRRKPAKKKAASNREAQWQAYRDLQHRVEKAWAKLRSDVRKKASPEAILKDRNELLLLLGECDYMAREAARLDGRWSRGL